MVSLGKAPAKKTDLRYAAMLLPGLDRGTYNSIAEAVQEKRERLQEEPH
jgi:hypothetical protein